MAKIQIGWKEGKRSIGLVREYGIEALDFYTGKHLPGYGNKTAWFDGTYTSMKEKIDKWNAESKPYLRYSKWNVLMWSKVVYCLRIGREPEQPEIPWDKSLQPVFIKV